ncbi:E3 ubiquitin ligase family protein [Halomarina salina]|uniref:RING-type E3 ubiquitin transferase n=1 Tax=Halomarina salina TaxID=1872699 RepID=A0ABD5RL53_9EURY|nr:E3 ubiquitin ligase family protein [Halomarina salina]
MTPLSLFGGIALLLGGGVAGLFGWRRRGHQQLVAETPTTDVRTIADPGVVELVGTVEPAPDAGPGTFSSPIGQRDCVVAGWEAEEWSERGDHSNWWTLGDGVRSVPFYLDDGTDRVLVEPGRHSDPSSKLTEKLGDLGDFDASVSVDNVVVDFHTLPVVQRVGAESETPAHIRRFVDGERAVGRQTGSVTNLVDIGNAHGDRRYYENTIAPGEEVYLLGYVRARDASDRDGNVCLRPETALVTPPREDEDGAFILSARGEDALLRGDRVATAALAGGVLAVLVGFSLLAGVVVPGV